MASNSDVYSESINTSSDESLSEDNIDTNLISDTNSSDNDSDAEHSSKNSDAEHSNKNSDIEHSNKKYNIKTKSRKNTSWVWQYFRKRTPLRKWKTRANCIVIIKCKKSPNGQRECGQLVKTQGSTGNFQTHLNTHGITKPIKVINSTVQPTIIEMFHRAGQSSRQKESIDHALVKWIVTNLQPLYILQNKSFIEFVCVLNPYYELPSDKYIKELIHQSYNYSVTSLKKLFTSEIKTCGLTCDFWTARSKSGYIGVTCHFINSDYKLKEVILAIRHVPYPHDTITIKNELENIISN